MLLLGVQVSKRGSSALTLPYNRHPLYLYSGDQKPGDVNGQRFFNLWYVLSPKGPPSSRRLPDVPSNLAKP
jgi:hypothetical protein